MLEVKPVTPGAFAPAISTWAGQGNVVSLAIAQALAGANSTVVYATGAILGNTLAPDKALATLPVSLLVVGMAASTLPGGAVARRYGRRAAFMAGTACGVLLGLLSAAAVFLGSCSVPPPFSAVSIRRWSCRSSPRSPMAFTRSVVLAPCPR